MDGVEGRDGVFVMAATSRPDLVDVALLRPGRIDKAVICNFPSLDDRKEIISIYLKKFNFREEVSKLQLDQFISDLAYKTHHFTSADLKGLIQNAQLARMSEFIRENSDKTDGAEFGINRADIEQTFQTFVKGMSQQEIRRFEEIYR